MSARVVKLPQADTSWEPLACQEMASRVATRDQDATAHLVLDVAIKEAIKVLRTPIGTPTYRHERAVLLLETATNSADRILGRTLR